MKDLEKHIKANIEARKLGKINPAEFVLKNPYGWDPSMLSQVIKEYQFLQKLEVKVPEWHDKTVLGYDKKAIEQCSSSLTAAYKFKNIVSKNSLDLTGGFGIDSFFLSLTSDSHHYCEQNEELAEIVKHNFKKLAVSNVHFHQLSAERYVSDDSQQYDVIFIDPDRRPSNNQRKFQLEDLSPNLLELKDKLYTLSPLIIIKLSPIIDLSVILESFTNVSKIQIIAIKGEVKEVVVLVEPRVNKNTTIETANYINSGWMVDEFEPSLEQDPLHYDKVKLFLYEPHAGLMKTQAWWYIQQQYKLSKIAPHSHYFTSDEYLENFPGRVLNVTEVYEFKKKNFKKWIGGNYSVLSRNFGKPAEQLKKQFKIKESAEYFLIFTSDLHHNKIVIIANKLNTL